MNKNNTNAVPLNTTTFNTRLLNTTKLNTNGFPVLSKRSGSSADISQAIMDSLVCWYDIGKQQCTNESMAANPVLADLSGNGHDIECFNFAWAGMSGIGGYMSDFTKGYYYNTKNESFEYITPTKFHFVKSLNTTGDIWKLKYIGGEIKLNVTGIPDDANFRIGTLSNVINLQNGINILDISSVVDADNTYGFSLSRVGECDITVEQLPLYPNALVSDGVDDYCYTNGLPILTDYTVIAKREYTNPSILYTRGNCFASKATTNADNEGAFVMELIDGLKPSSEFRNYNFGFQNIAKQAFDSNNPYVYQTVNSYNGEKIVKGTVQDTEDLFIFSLRSTEIGRLGSIALYSFLLFDRTLTTAEIEWVKKNMIESGGVLATNWADSSLWKNYLDGSRGIGVIKSTEIVINANTIGVSALFETIGERTIDSFTIKVTGLQNDLILYYKYNNGSSEQLLATMIEDGVYTLPQVSGKYIGFMFNKKFENENIVIQQLLSE